MNEHALNYANTISNLAVIYPIYYSVINGQYYLVILFVLSSIFSVLYHLTETNTAIFGSRRLRGISGKIRPYERVFLYLDRIVAALILFKILSFAPSTIRLYWLLILLIASEYATGWNYVILHSLWHFAAYIVLGSVIRASG